MDRRTVFACAGSVFASLSGCLHRNPGGESSVGETATRTYSETSTNGDSDRRTTDSTDEVDPDEQYLVVVNDDDRTREVRVSIERSGSVVLDHRTEVAGAARAQTRLPIDEPGVYEFRVTVAGEVAETWSVDRGDHALRSGSNVFVAIEDGTPRVYWEE